MTTQLKKLIDSCATITSEQWEAVQPLITTQTYKKGESFLSVGEAPDYFGFIEEGLFRIYYVDGEGKEAIKTFRGPGGVIGSYAEYLRKVPSRLNVDALTDSVVCVVKADDVFASFEKDATWERVGRRVIEQMYLEKEEREYQFLCMDANERYQAFLQNFSTYEELIPDYMVASFLGITPVYLSKLKNSR